MTLGAPPALTAWASSSTRPAAGRAGQRIGEPVRDLALEDRAEAGDPGRDADLAKRGVDPRGHPAARGRHDADRGVGQRGVREPDAEPDTMKPGSSTVQSEPASSRAISSRPHADEHEARAEHRAGRQPRGELARRGGGEERQDGQREEDQPRLERAVAEDRLHVQGDVEEHREHRGRQREGGDRDAAERPLAKQLEVEHRPPLAALDDQEEREQQRRRRRACRRSARWPSPPRCRG